MAIIGMAQTFVGSNNINLLMPNGQFGTRLQGGSDAASPRFAVAIRRRLPVKGQDEALFTNKGKGYMRGLMLFASRAAPTRLLPGPLSHELCETRPMLSLSFSAHNARTQRCCRRCPTAPSFYLSLFLHAQLTKGTVSRYIFTLLSQMARTMFPESDDAILNYLTDDGQVPSPSQNALTYLKPRQESGRDCL